VCYFSFKYCQYGAALHLEFDFCLAPATSWSLYAQHVTCNRWLAVILWCATQTPAVTARAKLETAIQSLLAAAASQQTSVLQQVQGDLLALLQLVVLPQLSAAGGVIKEPQLSAVSRIIKGRQSMIAETGRAYCVCAQ
jgi:hypothetical protein